MLSDFGRLFADDEGRVISFKLSNPDDQPTKALVVGSMKDKVDGEEGKLYFKVSRVVSAQGQVKRYIVHDIRKKD